MTLIYKFDLDILHSKNEVSRSRLSKVRKRGVYTDTEASVSAARAGDN